MTEEELRRLVRDAIAAQSVRRDLPWRADAREAGAGGRGHLSHAQFDVGPGPDGSCIIEPSVMCNHCGYCKSYGH